jgi:hypothetical protein
MGREGLDDVAEAERLVRDGEARLRQQLGRIVLLEQRGQAALAYDAPKLLLGVVTLSIGEQTRGIIERGFRRRRPQPANSPSLRP